jgi:hypothetical protein
MSNRYFILHESKLGAFGLPATYEGNPGRSWRTQRRFSRHQWHHIVNRYIQLCARGDGAQSTMVCVKGDAILDAIWNGNRQPVPFVSAVSDGTVDSCCWRARIHDPLFTGCPTSHPTVQWYTRTVLPVTLGHLPHPPLVCHRTQKRRTRPSRPSQPSRPLRHHVIRKRIHIVHRRPARGGPGRRPGGSHGPKARVRQGVIPRVG